MGYAGNGDRVIRAACEFGMTSRLKKIVERDVWITDVYYGKERLGRQTPEYRSKTVFFRIVERRAYKLECGHVVAPYNTGQKPKEKLLCYKCEMSEESQA